MNSNVQVLIVNNIKLPINASSEEAFSIARRRLKILNLNLTDTEFKIFRRSIDARNKNDIKFVYSVSAKGDFGILDAKKLENNSITVTSDKNEPDFLIGEEKLSAPPLVVGSGPCGLFAALLLAEQGYKPILIERGGSIEERISAVKNFASNKILDTESNIQFGAGGAGTFSDGKLITRINDVLTGYIIRRFVEFGAPDDIEYTARPHIGTDVLSHVVDNMLSRITELGGKVLFHTKLLSVDTDKSIAITNNSQIPFGVLILAIGHSARDTYENLFMNEFSIIPKAFSVGMRIEHLADDIDKAMYGDMAGNELLGRAEYNLSHNTKVRGVYTFCMCPGGEVVAAASENGRICVNGMSNRQRDGKNSNSAVVCSIFPQDYGNTPQKAISFQRKIEADAYRAGGANYSAPIVTVGDFLSGKQSSAPTKVLPTYMAGNSYTIASPDTYLPKLVTDSIKNAIEAFDKKIVGFADSSAILTGAETRTSSPIRILRDPQTLIATGFTNIYPAGEGAGYAGGITSAAVDGVKCAVEIMKKYKPIH